MSETPTRPIPGILRALSAAEEATLDERGIPTKLGRQYRRTQVASDGYNADDHTVDLALSSESPVDRYYGKEILSHKKGAIRTDRLKQGIPLLFNHDPDKHLGRSVSFNAPDGGPLTVKSRFGSNPLAKEKEADVADGILVDVSVGYLVHEWDITEDKNGNRTYTATDWEPLEGTLATVPADPTVGVGRGADDVPVKVRSFTSERAAAATSTDPDADDDDDEDDPDEDDVQPERTQSSAASTTHSSSTQRTPTMAEETRDLAAEQASRRAALRAIRKMNPTHYTEDELYRDSDSSEGVDVIANRVADKVIKAAEASDVSTVGDDVFGRMSSKEQKSYSLRNIYCSSINAVKPGTFRDKGAEAGFEREVGQELQKQAEERGVTGFTGGIVIPSATSRSLARAQQQRALASGGNAGTETNVVIVEPDPIELLRYRTACLALGARMMGGLFGTVKMPRQSAAGQSNWLAEGSNATETDPALDAIELVPTRLSIWNAYYRELLLQSALSVDSFLAQDRMNVLARSLDSACLAGSGTAPVPLGLLNQTGLAAVLAGTTRSAAGVVTAGAGGVPMTFVDYNNLESAISTANADIGTMSYLTTPKVRAGGRSTPQIPGGTSPAAGFVWPNSKIDPRTGIQEGPLGYPALATSNPVLTGFTANGVSNLHAVILGVWDQMLIGDWGLSEIIVDPYTGAQDALYNITEHAFYGTNVRHLQSFAACTSALPS